MMSIDTLQKAMPSLHLALAATASLHAPQGYRRLSWCVTGLIALSTLYLGIHWVSDLVIGAAIAYGCHLALPIVQAYLADVLESTPAEGVHGD